MAVGGVIGAEARDAATHIWPVASEAFPLTTFLVNVLGCALIGLTIVCLCRVRAVSELARPFLATGILGGFTTFFACAVDSEQLAVNRHLLLGVTNMFGTLAACLAAVFLTARATRRVADTQEGRLRR